MNTEPTTKENRWKSVFGRLIFFWVIERDGTSVFGREGIGTFFLYLRLVTFNVPTKLLLERGPILTYR